MQWQDEPEVEWLIGNHCDEVGIMFCPNVLLIFLSVILSFFLLESMTMFSFILEQLTPWFPVMTSRSQVDTKFFLLPWYVPTL
jgi:hypothetical protein